MARTRTPSRATLVDLALVLFITAVSEVAVFSAEEHFSTPIAGPRWLTVPLPLLIALPLLWRRRRPLLVTALVMSGIVAQAVASGNTPEGLQIILIWVVVPYSVAAYSERRQALIGLALVLAAFAVYSVQNDNIVSGRASDLWAGAFFLILTVGAWVAGMAVHGRREAVALAAQASALEREAEIASADERARIARELHDIVSHNLSVVVVQAAGARAQGDQQGSDAATLEKIERSGREALVEMRRLLGVLRGDDGDSALEPQPGIAQLRALAERVRAAGLPVDLTIDGDCGRLPLAIDLSAYRIVQEALTNTLKHAGREATARVRVRREPDALTIEVIDDGGRRAAGAESPGPMGHGLAGMRERVALFGGELRAGTRPGGGFLVSARLPLGSAGRR
jgi:signal transduction histidine kinase